PFRRTALDRENQIEDRYRTSAQSSFPPTDSAGQFTHDARRVFRQILREKCLGQIPREKRPMLACCRVGNACEGSPRKSQELAQFPLRLSAPLVHLGAAIPCTSQCTRRTRGSRSMLGRTGC